MPRRRRLTASDGASGVDRRAPGNGAADALRGGGRRWRPRRAVASATIARASAGLQSWPRATCNCHRSPPRGPHTTAETRGRTLALSAQSAGPLPDGVVGSDERPIFRHAIYGRDHDRTAVSRSRARSGSPCRPAAVLARRRSNGVRPTWRRRSDDSSPSRARARCRRPRPRRGARPEAGARRRSRLRSGAPVTRARARREGS